MIPRIALLDYGMGNLHSVSKALEHVGAKVDWIREAGDFDDYHGMILPGVGHYCQEDAPEVLVSNIRQFMQS